MKLYKDKDENFYYVEAENGKWYENPYKDDDFKEVPPIKHIEHAGLIECDIYEIDYPEFITDCKDCNNKGFLSHDEDGVELCICYHAKEGYENANNEYEIKRAYQEDYEDDFRREKMYDY